MPLPPLADMLRNNVPWAAIASVVAKQVESRVDTSVEIVEQLKTWGAYLSKNAITKWAAAIADPKRCEVPNASSGKIESCTSTGIVQCDCCGRRCCLAHCRVDFQADAVCAVCIGAARRHFKDADAEYKTQRKRAEAKKVAAAFRALLLDKTASMEDVRKSYKRLAFLCNADRPQSDAERAKNTKRLTRLNEAFAILKTHFEQQETA